MYDCNVRASAAARKDDETVKEAGFAATMAYVTSFNSSCIVDTPTLHDCNTLSEGSSSRDHHCAVATNMTNVGMPFASSGISSMSNAGVADPNAKAARYTSGLLNLLSLATLAAKSTAVRIAWPTSK